MHDCPLGQTLPHIPQFAASVAVATQRPPHTVWPAGHTHAPAVHVWPVAQTFPHRPQLFTSVAPDTQRPLQ